MSKRLSENLQTFKRFGITVADIVLSNGHHFTVRAPQLENVNELLNEKNVSCNIHINHIRTAVATKAFLTLS